MHNKNITEMPPINEFPSWWDAFDKFREAGHHWEEAAKLATQEIDNQQES